MAVSQATRERVYRVARAIFSGADAQLRKRKPVTKLVRSHAHVFAVLLWELGEDVLVDVVRSLLESRVFESTVRAKAEFPGLFVTTERDTEREAKEAEAARSSEVAWGLVQSDESEETVEEEDNDTDVPPRQALDTDTISVPSLYPCYIPYKPQHLLLNTSQQILEEACFDFAVKWLPNIVQEHGWDCPAAVELHKWTNMLGDKYHDKIPPLALETSASSLKQLLTNTHKLRHTAVHRLPTTARGISQLLQYGLDLAVALKDHRRAAQMEGLKVEVDSKIRAMELSKNFLENDTGAKLEEIRRQREELARRERELVAGMVREDGENKELVGRLLVESVGRVMSETMGGEEKEEEEEVEVEGGVVVSDAEGEGEDVVDDSEREGEDVEGSDGESAEGVKDEIPEELNGGSAGGVKDEVPGGLKNGLAGPFQETPSRPEPSPFHRRLLRLM